MRILRPLDVYGNGRTSKEILELLFTNGWDINARDTKANAVDAKPFMWHVISSYDTVAWCLQHGADPTFINRRKSCPPILESVAAEGDIDTFKLLRSKGAPLGERTLHWAVEAATYGPPDQIDQEKETEKDRKYRISHEKRMDMVRYLIQKVRLDVNALDQSEGRLLAQCKGTPICFIPGSAWLERDTKELTWLLLDQGADPNPGLEFAALTGYTKFAEDVAAWKAKKDEARNCCVQ